MRLVNTTDLRFALVPSRLDFPGHTATLVVKGTFDLVDGGTVQPSKEQPFPCGDVPYADDEAGTGPPRYASDLAPYKPCTDVLLAGSCHAPGGQPVARCEARIRVGDFTRALVVVGDRSWRSGLLGGKASDPAPFVAMELRYQRALGGPSHAANPVGIGQGHREALPNLAWAADGGDLPEPACFAPIPPLWALRRQKLGTFDKQWLRSRWPWLPADLDPTHFQSAPPAMQLRGHLRGDEALLLRNLHPRLPELHTQLPALRVRCFVERTMTAAAAGEVAPPPFAEVPMVLDTLFVDADAAQVVLVWRGHTNVVDEDCDDLARIGIVVEPLGEAPADIDECRRRLDAHDADDLEPAPAVRAPAPAPAPPPPAPEPPPDPEVAALEAELLRLQQQAGIATEPGDELGLRAMTDAQRRETATLLAATGMPVDEILAFGFRRDELPADIPAEMARLQQLGAQLGLPAEATAPPTAPAPPPGPAHTRATVAAALAAGGDLEDADLHGLDLSGLDFRGARLQRAVLAGCRLAGCDFTAGKLAAADLSGADLGGCKLTDASLPGANLAAAKLAGADCTGADLAAADLSRADLTGAMLADADLARARLQGALLRQAVATGIILVDAELAGADCAAAQFDGGDLSQARLDGASFAAASLVDVTLERAHGDGVQLPRANLTGVRAEGAALPGGLFRDCQGAGANFTAARLDGAVFVRAGLDGAMFDRASLVGADFRGCRLRTARFRKARLARARLVGLDLFEGSLEKADLTGADLSLSSLYGVEFLDAKIDGIRAVGANFKMTKLAHLSDA